MTTTHKLTQWQIAAIEGSLDYALQNNMIDPVCGKALLGLLADAVTITVKATNPTPKLRD